MPATELFCRLLGVTPLKLSIYENLILELDLFTRIYEQLRELNKAKYKDYFSLLNVNAAKEEMMLKTKFMRFIIDSILETEEYSLEGIARYTETPFDVICDISSGKNQTPSLEVSRKIIELHKFVRPDLYKAVIKKISEEYLSLL